MKEKLLQLRKKAKAKKPDFINQDSHKKKRLPTGWRRPRGIDSKMRLGLNGYRTCVSQGYRSPRDVRGLHSSGLKPVIVNSLGCLAKLDKETQGAVIAASVGKKKKLAILKEAEKNSIKILNVKDTSALISSIEEERQKIKEKKTAAKKAKEAKKKEKEKKAEEKAKKEEKEEKEGGKAESATAKTPEGLAEKVKSEEEKEKEVKKEKDKVLTTKA